MVLKLYYDLLSQPSRALYIFLKLNRIPFEQCHVDLIRGEHKTDEFKQNYSKFQKVPFIHDGDFRLTERSREEGKTSSKELNQPSLASWSKVDPAVSILNGAVKWEYVSERLVLIGIMRYISREFPIEDHWYPKDSKMQAKIDEYLEWQHHNIRLNCSVYLITNWTNPMLTGKKPPKEKFESSRKYMLRSLSAFEELFLSDSGPFLMGEKISCADIQAACEIEQPRIAGYNPMNHYPKIKTWIELVRKECNPYYDEAHERLNELAEIAESTEKSKL